ncbi:hypothetical protein LCGC14_2161770 [marine sediment metagenome]|uniref:Uncharacterized protein n=1 Tax=marine sediment metagenome TaxID=412755 RepID=A0A0F9DSI5_9ZZZZ
MCYSRPIQDNDYDLRVCKGCYMHVRKTVGFLWQEGWAVQKPLEPAYGPPDTIEDLVYPDPPTRPV